MEYRILMIHVTFQRSWCLIRSIQSQWIKTPIIFLFLSLQCGLNPFKQKCLLQTFQLFLTLSRCVCLLPPFFFEACEICVILTSWEQRWDIISSAVEWLTVSNKWHFKLTNILSRMLGLLGYLKQNSRCILQSPHCKQVLFCKNVQVYKTYQV